MERSARVALENSRQSSRNCRACMKGSMDVSEAREHAEIVPRRTLQSLSSLLQNRHYTSFRDIHLAIYGYSDRDTNTRNNKVMQAHDGRNRKAAVSPSFSLHRRPKRLRGTFPEKNFASLAKRLRNIAVSAVSFAKFPLDGMGRRDDSTELIESRTISKRKELP
ncbi:hypothetical protein EVAR_52283_1 [Eumeta japonica]|uniref:Uncharacterized protein n=1 Tax=Eumeta variegata TaxID=151549 RepID=A0A4C1ZPE1_EUMVA|nr:hypothetical protein EVAR_52283_1 [Eumeta japonica]